MGKFKNNVTRDLDDVANAMNIAKSQDLECEVMLYSLYYMKENPDSTIADSLIAGLEEWDL